jgi:acyl dehydratase
MMKGMYFEEFEVGYEVMSQGRTITETDIVMFAGLSGDYNQLHTDEEYCKEHSHFKTRIAHGLLVLSISSGLAMQLRFVEGTVLAFRELTWKFTAPVYIGDTIRVKATVTETRELKRLGGGQVVFDVEVLNQDDRVVQKGDWKLLVKSKPEE